MFETILIVTQILLLASLGFFVMYLFALSLLALVASLRPSPHIQPILIRHFAVVVPAHNEEFTIIPTIESLLRFNYPRDHFDVFVIADNCTDHTAKVSAEHGAIVLKRVNNELRGKGYALRWCFDSLLNEGTGYEAYVVIDADSIASANFLAIMNETLDQGAHVIQSSDLVKPQPGAWSSEMTRLGFTLYNYTRPLGRRLIKCSAGLRGNGMCFTAQVLRAHPWHAYSRTEDLEFGLSLLLKDVPVVFAPEASVLATMPQNPKLAESQRARWEGGRLPVIRRYAPALLTKAFSHGSFQSLDALIDLITPALINLMAMVVICCLATVCFFMLGSSSMLTFLYLWGLLLLLGFLHMFIGLYASRADKWLYKALFYLPRYILWKAMLYLKIMKRGKTEEWVRTTREPDPGTG